MLKEILLKRVYNEYKSLGAFEKKFIFLFMAMSFLICAEASITRVVSNSLYIAAYGAKSFPKAWLISVPINLFVVLFYNHFLPRLGCALMLNLTIGISILVNIVSTFYIQDIPFLPFALYLWKDIFIILMFQQIWSVIHATISQKRAKYLFGIFFGMGGLGSVFGSSIPGFCAIYLGSENLLLLTIPLYICSIIVYSAALRVQHKILGSQDIAFESRGASDILSGMRMIRGSRLLKFILLTLVCMQMTATLFDFQFALYVEKKIAIMDLRTQFIGRLFGIINIVNVFFQFIGVYLLVEIAGLFRSHLFVPLMLFVCSALCIFNPCFATMAFSFASVKVLDYSIFGAIKEMLYLPLGVEEKFRAKSFIDVFAYRSSKALASILILILNSVFISYSASSIITYLSLTITAVWMILVLFMFSSYKEAITTPVKN
jgi:ATP:ADP antiporter, AAA family